jgi:predicted MFS family arabinose efflux permease
MSNTSARSNHWILIVGQLLAQFSDRMMSIGLIWVITKNFGEQWVTWYLVIGGLPHLFFSVYSSRIIRSIGALKVVIRADWLRSLLYFLAGFFIVALEQKSQLYQVVAIIFLANAMAAFFNPAILSLPVELKKGDQVQKLTAQLSTVTSLASILGPLLGMFCFEFFGLRGLFFICSGSYLLSGFCASRLKITAPPHSSTQESPTFEARPESMKGYPLIVSMLIVFLILNFLVSPIQVLMPSLAKIAFSGSFNSLAAMEIGLGAGIVLGGLLLSLFSVTTRVLLYSWYCLIGIGISFLAFQYSSSLWAAVGALVILGLLIGVVNVLIINIFQSAPRSSLVPRIMGYVNLISTAAVPLSLACVGLAQIQFSIIEIGKVSGSMLLLACLLSLIPFRRWGRNLI